MTDTRLVTIDAWEEVKRHINLLVGKYHNVDQEYITSCRKRAFELDCEEGGIHDTCDIMVNTKLDAFKDEVIEYLEQTILK